jgi:hypothetical protein
MKKLVQVTVASLPLLIFPMMATFMLPNLLTGVGNCDRGLADYFLSAYFAGYVALFLW